MRRTAIGDQFVNIQALGNDRPLRQDREPARDVARPHLSNIPAIEQNLSTQRVEQPTQPLEQCRFARPVGADKRRHRAFRDGKTDVMNDGFRLIGQIEACGRNRGLVRIDCHGVNTGTGGSSEPPVRSCQNLILREPMILRPST